MVARLTTNQEVAGSSPVLDYIFAFFCSLPLEPLLQT